jgi:hypothetical protein
LFWTIFGAFIASISWWFNMVILCIILTVITVMGLVLSTYLLVRYVIQNFNDF